MFHKIKMDSNGEILKKSYLHLMMLLHKILIEKLLQFFCFVELSESLCL